MTPCCCSPWSRRAAPGRSIHPKPSECHWSFSSAELCRSGQGIPRTGAPRRAVWKPQIDKGLSTEKIKALSRDSALFPRWTRSKPYSPFGRRPCQPQRKSFPRGRVVGRGTSPEGFRLFYLVYGGAWRSSSRTAAATCSTLIPLIQRRSMGHSRRKQGEQGAPHVNNRWRALPGSPGPVKSCELLPNSATTRVPTAAATCIGPVSLVSRTRQDFKSAISSRREVLPHRS